MKLIIHWVSLHDEVRIIITGQLYVIRSEEEYMILLLLQLFSMSYHDVWQYECCITALPAVKLTKKLHRRAIYLVSWICMLFALCLVSDGWFVDSWTVLHMQTLWLGWNKELLVIQTITILPPIANELTELNNTKHKNSNCNVYTVGRTVTDSYYKLKTGLQMQNNSYSYSYSYNYNASIYLWSYMIMTLMSCCCKIKHHSHTMQEQSSKK